MTDGRSDTSDTSVDPAEPSMEDILASIRQLIAEDDAPLEPQAKPAGLGLSEAVDIVTTEDQAAPLELTNAIEVDDISDINILDDLDPLNSFIDDANDTEDLALGIPEIEVADADNIESVGDVVESYNIDVPELPTESELLNEFTSPESDIGSKEINPVALETVDDLDDWMSDIVSDDNSVQDNLDGLEPNIDSHNIASPQALEVSEDSLKTSADNVETQILGADDDNLDIDSLLSEMSEDILPELDVEPVAENISMTDDVDVAAEPPTNVTDDIDHEFDSLISDLRGADEAQPTALDAVEPLETSEITQKAETNLETSALDDVEQSFDNLLADFSSDENIDAPSTETLDVESPDVESGAQAEIDPDIALVKSLMADLTDTLSDDTSADADLSEDLSLGSLLDDTPPASHEPEEMKLDGLVEDDDLSGITDLDDLIEAEAEENTLISDILEDTIVSEESVQDEIQSDIMAQLTSLAEGLDDDEPGEGTLDASVVNEDADGSTLSKLADLLEEAPGEDDTAENNVSKTAIVGGTVTASLAAAATVKPSALDTLLNDGFDIDKILDMTPQEARPDASKQAPSESDDVIESLMGLSAETEGMSDEDDETIEALLSDIMSEGDISEQPKGAEEADMDLGNALAGLLDDDLLEDNLGTEIDVPELDATDKEMPEVDILEQILDDDAVEDVDLTSETVDINVETSQTEIADMARKTATDTILNEVTETAAASAFASLNQVVEEKAVVAERGDRIGDLVTEALQPMLKEWLDKNLKGIVERAVAKEVKRISSGK